MTIRSVLFIILLIGLCALLVIGRLHRRQRLLNVRSHQTSLFQQRDRPEQDPLRHLAPQGKTPRWT